MVGTVVASVLVSVVICSVVVDGSVVVEVVLVSVVVEGSVVVDLLLGVLSAVLTSVVVGVVVSTVVGTYGFKNGLKSMCCYYSRKQLFSKLLPQDALSGGTQIEVKGSK